ncbi:MAG TPA: hydroxymethylbilane synthase [Gemmatimonadales bacterium]|nr:hydroxymethylbilane synthase [Gemmatimonadales bacterium]
MSQRRSALRIGTRGSTLAVWQTEWVRARLRESGYESERIEIKTTGDLVGDVPLARIGSRALFTKQIDDALLEGRIDLAVHSFKDLPTQLPDGITVAAVGQREDPRDALVGRGPLEWDDLPQGGVVATSSLRRRAQLLHSRPDLTVVDVRGNVETRLAKLDNQPAWSGILLAAAGLVRLGLERRIGERLPPALMLPAPAQGALVVTVRAGDTAAETAAHRAVHHPESALSVAAERGFLRRLEGGCQVPVGAYAELDQQSGRPSLRLHGRVVALQGDRMVEGREAGVVSDENEAGALGSALADRLLSEGASEILAEARSAVAPAVSEP